MMKIIWETKLKILYRAALLFGKSIQERARELIKIAHPTFRDELTQFAKETYNI